MYLITVAAIISVATAVVCFWLIQAEDLASVVALAVAAIFGVFLSILFGFRASKKVLEPLKMIRQGILHVSPDHGNIPPPNLDSAKIGRELVTSLVLQVYEFASQQSSRNEETNGSHKQQLLQATNIVSHLPLPLFVFNQEQLVTNASDSAMQYCQLDSTKLLGKPLYESLHLEFRSEHTLEKWLKDCQNNKINDTAYWERVRIRQPGDDSVKQCDMAAYYNRNNPSGTEFIVTLFDRTVQYNQDDESMGFVALAVHELRTPLTMLRGYIELFEEELGDKLDDELKSFMYKMEASASQLTAFVNNILNVSRIEANQMAMQLNEENWEKTLRAACRDGEMWAKVNNKKITYQIDKNLPTVAVDRISIYEVINNLIENAVKYSPKSEKIVIASSLNNDGFIETTVQDFGMGIPNNVLPYLFGKFYRNHRTKSEVGGTGLGLYLCKTIVEAHGGQVWAKSKEGEGSTFGFTLQPYSELADELKDGNNTNVTRTAHGWIKNHSLYRR